MGLIRNAKLLLKISPAMDAIAQTLTVPFTTHSLVHILVILAGALVGSWDLIPLKMRWVVIGVLMMLQMTVALINHGEKTQDTTELDALEKQVEQLQDKSSAGNTGGKNTK